MPYIVHSKRRCQLPLDGQGRSAAEAADEEGSDTPPVTLYGTQGDERREAARLLRDADVGFAEVDTANESPIIADFGGLTFEGVTGVRDLIEALRAMDEAFERAVQSSGR